MDGRSLCRGTGYNLVSIHSDEEEEYLNTQISLTGSWWDHWWIGFNDRGGGSEGSFYWSDGSDVVYTAWAVGEPNDAGRREDCAEMNYGSVVGEDWNDADCGQRQPYICKAN